MGEARDMGGARDMARDVSHGSPGLGSEEIEDPLGFIYGEHERIRLCWERLEHLAAEPAAADAPEAARAILAFIEESLPLHFADEEEDLFPLLKRRSPSDDSIHAVLELLAKEHRDDIEQGRTMVRALRAIAAGEAPADGEMFAAYVRAFVMLQRRHQAMENNLVMMAAFDRLIPEDIAELGRRIAARRGAAEGG